MKVRKFLEVLGIVLGLVAFAGISHAAIITPPDMSVCDGITCDDLPMSLCSAAGFKITLTNYEPANTSSSGTATYTYQICSPAAGTCAGGTGLRSGQSCLDNSYCQSQGQATDPTAYCTRECATDSFHGLSHFDVVFPTLGGIGSCLSEGTAVTGTCAVVDNDPPGDSSVGDFVLGDGSCFGPDAPVAKCDNTTVAPGDCVAMTLSIPGENTALGLGAAVVVDKESTTCTASCLAGPSCEACDEPPSGTECLTRTIGFWGTHPHIATLYDPVTVCGIEVNGQDAGTCSTSEALCFSANDNKRNPTYLSLVAQLTAAKLNLHATANLVAGASCSTWTYGGYSIDEWIASCEASFCNAGKQDISVSGCIAALTAFNESDDTGFAVTPPPFDRPGPADIEQCHLSRGNRIFIGACQ